MDRRERSRSRGREKVGSDFGDWKRRKNELQKSGRRQRTGRGQG